MPLRTRLALATAFVALLVFGVSAWFFASSFEDGLRESVDEGLRTQSDSFARQIEQRGDSLDLDDPRGAAVATGDVVAQVLASDGTVVESTREAGSQAVITGAEVARAGRGPVFTDVRANAEHEHFRVLAMPVASDGRARIAIVGASLESTDESARRLERGLLIGGAVAVVLSGVGAWLLAGAALGPVERMRRAAAEISVDDPGARLEVPRGGDELTALGVTVNELLARLQAALVREKALVADASHELRTPLALLGAELELASRAGRSPDELREAVASAVVHTNRLVGLTEALLFLAQTSTGQSLRREDVGIAALVDASIGRATARSPGARIVADVDRGVHGFVDPALVDRALDNLLQNAVRAAPPGSVVTVRAVRRPDGIAVTVLDEGPGFPPDFLPHAFERFRRADEARSRADGGAGLGLAIVQAIAEAHGGTARAVNENGHGAAVTLELPDM